MSPDDVMTITIDDHVHRVKNRGKHEIARQVITGKDTYGNPTVRVDQIPATRFTTMCGLGFDARHDVVDGVTWDRLHDREDPRWVQGNPVDCPSCQAASLQST